MASISLVTTPTITGNTPQEKMVGSIATIQIKKILQNALANEFVFKATASARSIEEVAGIATAIYNISKRKTWGVAYDYVSGATKQGPSAGYTTIQLDKSLNVKFEIEDYDINKFMESPVGVRTELVAGWLGSLTLNLLQNFELLFRRAIQDYCVARYEIDKTSVMVFDPSKIKTEDEAKQFFTDFGLRMIDKIRTIDDTMIGTNKSDWIANFSMKGMAHLTKAFTALVGGDISAKTLVSGRLYENSVFGLPIAEDFWLDDEYDKNSNRRMNIECSYNLKGTISEVVHTDAWAFPMGFSYFKQVINPENGNLRWLGKCRVSLPCNLRPNLAFIIKTAEPTSEEIKKAQAKGIIGPSGDEFDLETYTYQVALYDELADKVRNTGTGTTTPTLSSLISVLNLGKLADNQASTIISAIKSKNPKAPSDIALIGITDTEANVISNSAIGSVKVSFTK